MAHRPPLSGPWLPLWPRLVWFSSPSQPHWPSFCSANIPQLLQCLGCFSCSFPRGWCFLLIQAPPQMSILLPKEASGHPFISCPLSFSSWHLNIQNYKVCLVVLLSHQLMTVRTYFYSKISAYRWRSICWRNYVLNHFSCAFALGLLSSDVFYGKQIVYSHSFKK